MLRMRRRPGSRWPRSWTAPRRSPPACAARRRSHSTCWRRWHSGPGCGLTPPSCTPRSWSLPPALSLGRRAHECHAQADECPCALGNRAHCRGMMRYNEPLHLSSPAADALPADRVRLAASAYLARFTGSSREHTESDLRCYLRWCADRGLDPLAARRPDLEQYIRWMQETGRFKPSTISRRFSVAAGFYRTCVIDGVLEHSRAEHSAGRARPRAASSLAKFSNPAWRTENSGRERSRHQAVNWRRSSAQASLVRPAKNPARASRSALVQAGWIVASATDGTAVVIGHLPAGLEPGRPGQFQSHRLSGNPP